MNIYLARHGQTNYNVQEILNDDPSVDVHLTELGKKQAKEIAEKLKNVPLETIYVSELRRTKQTADIVNANHSVPVIVDPLLNDFRTGFEGKPARDYYSELLAAPDIWNTRLNGGESIEDLRERVESFIEELKDKNYSAVLVITSMAVVQAMYGLIKGLTYEEAWNFKVDTGLCVEVEL